jgi:hypothetical protein
VRLPRPATGRRHSVDFGLESTRDRRPRATFGLEGDPFENYSFRERSWKVKFRALAAPPAELEEAMREAGLSPRRENPRT